MPSIFQEVHTILGRGFLTMHFQGAFHFHYFLFKVVLKNLDNVVSKI